jgi:hypothetical protein
MDWADMIKYVKYNDGYKYILLVVDAFSKYIWVRKLKGLYVMYLVIRDFKVLNVRSDMIDFISFVE